METKVKLNNNTQSEGRIILKKKGKKNLKQLKKNKKGKETIQNCYSSNTITLLH